MTDSLTQTEKLTPVRRCGCIEKINKALEPRNTGLDIGQTMNFTTCEEGEAVLIRVFKLDRKKKGAAFTVFANHCPFCGVKYAAA